MGNIEYLKLSCKYDFSLFCFHLTSKKVILKCNDLSLPSNF